MTTSLPALAKLKPNPSWASLPLFDRTGWKRMAFGGEHRGTGGAEGCAGGDLCGAGASGPAVPAHPELGEGQRLGESIFHARDTFFDDELSKGQKLSPDTMKNLGAALVKIVVGKRPKASSEPATKNEYGVLKVSAAGDGAGIDAVP